MRKSKTTKIFRSGNHMYSLNKSETDISIQIQANYKIEAEKAFTLPNLKELSIYFCLFQSVESIYDDLITLSKANKITIDDKSEAYYFTLNINMKEVNTITLTIPKQVDTSPPQTIIEQFPMQTINSRFDNQDVLLNELKARFDLFEAVMKQQSELLNMLVDAKSTNEKNNVVNHNKNSLQSNDKMLKISQFEFEISNNKNNNRIKDNVILQSDNVIINGIKDKQNQIIVFPSEQEKAMVSNWIAMGKQCTWNLLYNPIKGKDTYDECLKLCYNKPSIAVLIETNTGCKFGGYTAVGWDIPKDTDTFTYKEDANAFLFSIDKGKQYTIKKEYTQKALCCLKDYCFTFFSGLGLCDNFLTSKENRVQLTQYGNDEPKYEINNGENTFMVKHLFAFQILFSN